MKLHYIKMLQLDKVVKHSFNLLLFRESEAYHVHLVNLSPQTFLLHCAQEVNSETYSLFKKYQHKKKALQVSDFTD